MEKFMLISVAEREITLTYHETHEEAYTLMEQELDETGEREDYTEGEDYELEAYGAWSNMNHHCNCDWMIVDLTSFGATETDSDIPYVIRQVLTDFDGPIADARVDALTQRRNELRRSIADKRSELTKVEAALKTASHKPAKQISCQDLRTKIGERGCETPVVVYEGKIPKKITKVIVSENHVRLEISSNLQTEYQE